MTTQQEANMKYKIIAQLIEVIKRNKSYIIISILLVIFTPYLRKIGLF
jgi:hypothetical protein